MPWLLGTALLHSAIVAEKRDALKSWTVLLAILTFSLSLLGTFLVRSGVLTSVHAFATDPKRGIFILLFLALVTGGALALYAVRAPQMKTGGLFAPLSREGSLIMNNLLLSVACGAVLVGTLYPLFLDALTGEKVSVGPPYFNLVFGICMLALFPFMGVGPLLAWKRGDLPGAMQRVMFAAAVAAIAAIVVLYLSDRNAALGAVGVAVALWIIGTTLTELAERIRLFASPVGESLRRLGRLPRAAWGMTVAHAGMGLMVLGIAASTAWQTEILQAMRPGETVKLASYDVTFDGVKEVRGPNYTARQGTFRIAHGGQPFITLHPESRRYPQPPMDTTEAAIWPMLSADLYIVVGEADGRGGHAVRLYHKPLVSWIWGGALVMVLGGMISLTDRRHRVGSPRRVRAPATAAAAASAAE
jgi:cytochrome c-type biogenesis protein CcmF